MKKLQVIFISSLFIFPVRICAAVPDIAEAEKLFLQARYEKVIYKTDELIEARSRNRDKLYYLKGLSQLKLNRFTDARQSFETILNKYPKSKIVFDAYLGIGDSYFLEGDINNAQKIYLAMLDKFPNDRNIQIVQDRIKNCQVKAGPTYAVQNITVKRESTQFTVQVGCFKKRENARRLARKLSGKGYEARVDTDAGLKDTLYRVKVGKFASKEEAEKTAWKLKEDGYSTKISAEI